MTDMAALEARIGGHLHVARRGDLSIQEKLDRLLPEARADIEKWPDTDDSAALLRVTAAKAELLELLTEFAYVAAAARPRAKS